MRLTKREKTMLAVLLIFGSLALFIAYVLMPAMNDLQSERGVLSDLQYERDQQLIKLQTIAAIQQQLTDAEGEAQSLRGSLYSRRTYDTGLMLSDMLARYTLSPLSLTIGERTASPFLPEADETLGETQYAFCREITLRFTGERANADAFIDALSVYDTRYVLHSISVNHRMEATEYTLQLTLFEFDEA